MYRNLSLSLLVLALVFGARLWAQDLPEPQPSESEDPGAWQPPQQKTYTEAEMRAECRKYQNKLISYYSQVFKVENCKRREILSESFLTEWTSNERPIFSVDNDTIIKIPEGRPIAEQTSRGSFHCRQVEGSYVIVGNSDIFFVEGCRRRAFPDWESFSAHRQRHKLMAKPIVDLSEEDFRKLAEGTPFPSVMNNKENNVLTDMSEVDVIPINEACRGLNGRMVSYYSRIYRIEGCRKRELLDPDFGARREIKGAMPELSSEQWISLPDGEPI